MRPRTRTRTRTRTGTSVLRTLFVLFLLPAIALATRPADAAPDAPDDGDVLDAIETEFLLDPLVDFHTVEVAVADDGIVTLTGDVDHFGAKRRAARIAGVVKGVRSVVNRLRVEPAPLRTDEAIRDDVVAALLADPATDSYEVEVAVEDGEVTLSGDVDSWPERRLSGTVASAVRGVTGLDNDLRVEPRIERPDAEIAADVERSLEWDVLIDSGLIDVSVENGRVTLSGIAGSVGEKSRAKARAQVQGVNEVDDSGLRVQSWTRDEDLRDRRMVLREDAEIQKAVVQAHLRDPRVSAFGVHVDVEQGVATLRGVVDNVKARRAAVQDARNTVGVVRVRDHIRVKHASVDDPDLEQRVKAAILRDPVLELPEIQVTCNDGVVELRGEVDTWLERAIAEDVVSRVKGVAVIDARKLRVDDDAVLVVEPLVDDVHMHHLSGHRVRFDPLVVDEDALRADVEDQLFWSPFVDSRHIDVTVDGAVVTLTGTADHWVERMAAVMNAYEAGASWVDNDIRLRRVGTPGMNGP